MNPTNSIVLIFVFFSSSLFSQNLSEAFPKGNSNLYRLNFKVFYSSMAEADQDNANLHGLLKEFNMLKGSSTTTARNLLKSLQLLDSIQIKYVRLYNYFDLLNAVNRDEESKNRINEISAAFDTGVGFFNRELLNLKRSDFSKFVSKTPSLGTYSYYVQLNLRNKEHLLSEPSNKYISAISSSLANWQFELYQKTLRQAAFPDIDSKHGTLNVLRDRVQLETHPDSLVRKEGYQKLYGTYYSHRELYAFALINLANAHHTLAQAKNFKDASESFYFQKFYTKESINALFRQITDSIKVFKDYQTMRRDYLTKQQGRKLSIWDIKLSAYTIQPFYSIDVATNIICHSLLPLGYAFQMELQQLMNPLNGRMEIGAGKNKRPGNFSKGFIGTESILYATQYTGLYNDVRIITHEGTHAVHRALMNRNSVRPVYASGPNYLFESFAIFSEFLLSDYLIDKAKSKEEKRFYLEKYFEGKGMAIFSIAQDALLEQAIHEGVANGLINNSDDLDSVNNKINQLFSIWPTEHFPQQNLRWITNSLFYEDPFYNINYVLGAMVALQFYDLYKLDSAAFQKKYEALLQNGFTDAPAPLLKRFLDVDISDPKLLTRSIHSIRVKLIELRKLYDE